MQVPGQTSRTAVQQLAAARPRWPAFSPRPSRHHRTAGLPRGSNPNPDLLLCRAVATAKRGEVLLIADTLGKSHDGEKQLFQGLTFSVV
ncbi:hypothetical protein GPECTOR_1680g803 [Gonium pectorale]|uniref:Uncharacterized protein n=1 Tax=Gonium pectorale TaxID=33097 RepID=A0A150FTC7_GONPE|nr:hypothetical protein GPECTOR_1680g803 [Gonium pectorale]|eukprot:KXZ40871.1 hypothetical protein GPECTOR_1680g803 [Gonium pectorale]